MVSTYDLFFALVASMIAVMAILVASIIMWSYWLYTERGERRKRRSSSKPRRKKRAAYGAAGDEETAPPPEQDDAPASAPPEAAAPPSAAAPSSSWCSVSPLARAFWGAGALGRATSGGSLRAPRRR